MSDRGLFGVIVREPDFRQANWPDENGCICIGRMIPHVHLPSGSLPVFQVIEHPDGAPVVFGDGRQAGNIKRLLAYPSSWAAAGLHYNEWVYLYRSDARFNALIPLHDHARL